MAKNIFYDGRGNDSDFSDEQDEGPSQTYPTRLSVSQNKATIKKNPNQSKNVLHAEMKNAPKLILSGLNVTSVHYGSIALVKISRFQRQLVLSNWPARESNGIAQDAKRLYKANHHLSSLKCPNLALCSKW